MSDPGNHISIGMSDSGSKHISTSKPRKKLILLLFTSFLLVAAAVIGIVAGVNSRENIIKSSSTHSIVKSSCSSTFYPDLCYSTIANAPELGNKAISTPKDVIMMSLNATKTAVVKNYFAVKTLLKKKGLTGREKTALHDCLETIDETLDEIRKAKEDLNQYPSFNNSLTRNADDLKTLLSAAITNQETCLDGFFYDKADKKVRESLIGGQLHVEKMCSNALAMIKNMTDTDIANEIALKGRNLRENEEGGINEWPEWLSAGDRRLLQSTTVTPNVVVAADGSGDYRTVSAAVAAAPEGSSTRYVIRIKAGVYRENVDVPKKKTNLMFLGDGRTTTIITASRNVVDGSTTFNSATVVRIIRVRSGMVPNVHAGAGHRIFPSVVTVVLLFAFGWWISGPEWRRTVVGERFLARDITFQNTAGPSKHQAVALRVGADLSAFYHCDMIAYQDTLYVHSNRQFYINCYIAGTVDFIFGNAAAVLQDCDIHARRPNAGQKNMVTAQGRTDRNQNTGIVIQKCRIDATSDLKPVKSSFPTFLGRPWKLYSRTVVMQSTIGDLIDPAGWHIWDGTFALSTLEYREYGNSGAGAGTSRRVTWGGYKVITSATEAQQYTPGTFIAGGSWLRSTTFPFSLGL